MTKNAIYNILIGLFLCSGLYNLSACIFNGEGITDGNPTTSSITSEQSDSLVQTSNIEPTISQLSTSTCDLPITSVGVTEIIETTWSSTSIESTIGIDSTTDGTTILSSTTTEDEPICGDCIVNGNEECDWCSYEPIQGHSSCRMDNTNEYIKPCYIEVGPTHFPTTILLEGMVTPEFDKEEADLLCKIYGRRENMEAEDYQIVNILPPLNNIITTEKISDKSYLLQTKIIYENSLWYTKYDDIPIDIIGNYLKPTSCKII